MKPCYVEGAYTSVGLEMTVYPEVLSTYNHLSEQQLYLALLPLVLRDKRSRAHLSLPFFFFNFIKDYAALVTQFLT